MALPKYESLGFTPIKPVAKESNDSIKKALYAANDIIFKYRFRLADPHTANLVLSDIINIGKELADADCTQRCLAKKNEVLQSLRSIVKNVDLFLRDHPVITKDDYNDIWRSTRYFLSQYIKAKPNIKTGEDVIKWLEWWKELYDGQVWAIKKEYNLREFNVTGEELVKILKNIYNPWGQEIYLHKTQGAELPEYASFWAN